MKKRLGFVSNSSSSSFIVATKDKKDLKTVMELSVDLNNYVKSNISNLTDLKKYFKDNFDLTDEELEVSEKYQKMKRLLSEGYLISCGSFYDDTDDSVELVLKKYGVPNNKNIINLK